LDGYRQIRATGIAHIHEYGDREQGGSGRQHRQNDEAAGSS